jgi:polysaccharide transporter, PST family
MVDLPDRLRHSLSSQVAVQGFRIVIYIGINGWMSHYLGPVALGKLSYASALVGLLAPLGNLGVQSSLSALLCQPNPLPGLVPTALMIEILGTCILAIIFIPVSVLSHDPVTGTLILLSVLGNLFTSAEVFETELLVLQRGTLLARVGLMQVACNALLTSISILMQAPIVVFGWLQVIHAFVRCVLLSSLPSCQQSLMRFREVSMQTARALIQRGLPLMIAGLSVSLYMRSDMVMLQWLKGSNAVGQYSVAVKTAEALYFLPMILSNTLFSRIGKANSKHLATLGLRQLYKASWLLGIGMALTNLLLLPLLVPFVYGPQFQEAKYALALMAPAAFAVSMGYASNAWLQLMKLEWILTATTVAGAVVNAVLNLILIPKYGACGAAIATSVSHLVVTFAITLFVNKDTRANTMLLLYPFHD